MSLTAVLRDWNKLNTFIRVAERRSFTKAAADLRTTPSVVSKRMKELEEVLGFSLLSRSTHGVVLTEAGDGLYRNCLEALTRIDDFIVETRNMESGPFGTLRVQATSDLARFVVSPLVMAFAKRCPGLRVHLFVVEEGCAATEEGFDVVIADKRPSQPGLAAQDLGAIEHVVCAAPAYLRCAGRPKNPQDLREHNCLANLYSGLKHWPFKAGARQVQIEITGSLSSNSGTTVVQMAVEGCGIIRVPRHAVRAELESRALETLLDAAIVSTERMWIYYSKARQLPAKTTDFIEFVRASLATAGA